MSRSISVRLSEQAFARCEEARKKGYTRTEFIEQSILGINYYDRAFARQLIPHFVAIAESIASIRGNSDIKEEMRKELNDVCQFLSSPLEHI